MIDNRIILRDVQKICEQVDLRPLEGKTVLVTGASGLIGTYILACLFHLRKLGMPMRVYALSFSEVPLHLAEFVQDVDVMRLNLADFEAYPSLPQADIILHLAGYAGPVLSKINSASTIQINTTATIALLQRLANDGRLVYMSSSEVYSGLQKNLLTEADIGTTTPYHTRSHYIEGKRCGEAICHAFRTQGMHVTSVRLSHTYGPGTRKSDKRVHNSFVERALCQHKIELLDTGQAIRAYCYVADAVELIWQALLYGKEPVYNVGGATTGTIAELAQMISEMTGAVVVFPETSAGMPGAPEAVCLNLNQVKTEFGKTQYVSLEEGIISTIEWQRQLYC